VIPSLSPLRGGPSFALPLMANGLADLGVSVDVVTTDDDGPAGRRNLPLGCAVTDGRVTYRYFARTTSFYTSSWSLTAWLARHVRGYDLVHIHALFSYAALPASLAAYRSGVPYIVRPLGTLSRWSVEQRRPLLKRLSYGVLESRIVRQAAAMHYTSGQEQREAEMLGISTRPVVIPVPIDAGAFAHPPSRDHVAGLVPLAASRPFLLYLSRLDRKKGLDLLIPAFADVHVRHPQVLLVIAGSGDPVLAREVRDEVGRRGLDGDVVFVGHVDGDQKQALLAHAAAFVLPSYGENFGIAPVEAMAAGVPVVITDRVGIAPDVAAALAGLVVRPDASAIARALNRVIEDPNLTARLAANARSLAGSRYAIPVVATELLQAYESVVGS